MEPKYSKEDMKQLILEFEGMVRALNTKFDEDQIFRLVSMILQNHIQNGEFTEEYLQLSRQALHWKQAEGQQLNAAQKIILNGYSTDFVPRPKKI
jgi:hypothetical protein